MKINFKEVTWWSGPDAPSYEPVVGYG